MAVTHGVLLLLTCERTGELRKDALSLRASGRMKGRTQAPHRNSHPQTREQGVETMLPHEEGYRSGNLPPERQGTPEEGRGSGLG